MNPARYTRVVSTLKIVLPLVALGVLGTVFMITADDGFDPVFTFTDADFEAAEEGTGLANPRISGKTNKGEDFSLTANRIEPRPNDAQILVATAMTATLFSGAETAVEVVSKVAMLDLSENILHLPLGGAMTTIDGYFAQIDSAQIDLMTGEISGEMIHAEGDIGIISADNFRILVDSSSASENQVLWFENDVRVTIDIPDQKE